MDFESSQFGMQTLPAHKFRQGDIVGIERYQGKAKGSSGKKAKQESTGEKTVIQAVVARVSDQVLTIVLNAKEENAGNDDDDDADLSDTERYLIKRLAIDLPYERMKKAIENVKECIDSRPTTLVEVLFGNTKPDSRPLNPSLPIYDSGLNEPQRNAVRHALAAQHGIFTHFSCMDCVMNIGFKCA